MTTKVIFHPRECEFNWIIIWRIRRQEFAANTSDSDIWAISASLTNSKLYNKPSTDQFLNVGAFVDAAIVHDDH